MGREVRNEGIWPFLFSSDHGHDSERREVLLWGSGPLELCHKMAGTRLFFDGFSKSEDDSQQGSSSERGADPNAQVATVSGRDGEASEPFIFDD